MEGPVRYPAELFTREIPEKIASEAFAIGGSEIRIPLEKAGWLRRLLVKISGGYTVANAAIVLTERSPWRLASRFTFEPQGYQKVHDADGFFTHLLNLVTSADSPQSSGYERDAVGLDANTGLNRPRNVFPLALGAQTFELWFEIFFPRSVLDPTGALFIPHPRNTDLVVLPAAAIADLVTVAANFTVFDADVEVWQENYSRPPKSVAGSEVVPFGRGKALVNTYEQRQDVIATDENKIVYPNGGKLLHAFHAVEVANALNSADVESISLEMDGVQIYDRVDREIWDYITQKRNRGYQMPLGVIHFNHDDQADSDGAPYKLVPSTDDKVAMALQPSQGRWLHLDSVKDETIVNIRVAAAAAVDPADRIRTAFRRLRPIEVGI